MARALAQPSRMMLVLLLFSITCICRRFHSDVSTPIALALGCDRKFCMRLLRLPKCRLKMIGTSFRVFQTFLALHLPDPCTFEHAGRRVWTTPGSFCVTLQIAHFLLPGYLFLRLCVNGGHHRLANWPSLCLRCPEIPWTALRAKTTLFLVWRAFLFLDDGRWTTRVLFVFLRVIICYTRRLLSHSWLTMRTLIEFVQNNRMTGPCLTNRLLFVVRSRLKLRIITVYPLLIALYYIKPLFDSGYIFWQIHMLVSLLTIRALNRALTIQAISKVTHPNIATGIAWSATKWNLQAWCQVASVDCCSLCLSRVQYLDGGPGFASCIFSRQPESRLWPSHARASCGLGDWNAQHLLVS